MSAQLPQSLPRQSIQQLQSLQQYNDQQQNQSFGGLPQINPTISNQTEELFQKADILMFKEKKFNQAEQLYNQIIALDPYSVEALNSLANCLRFQSNSSNIEERIILLEKLKVIYEKALSIDPEDIEANFNIGLLYLQSSSNPNSKNNVGLQQKDMQKALEYFLKSVASDVNLKQSVVNREKESQSKHKFLNKSFDQSQSNNPQAQNQSQASLLSNNQQQQLYSQPIQNISSAQAAMNAYQNQLQELFRPQFAKAYFNIGIIYDRMGDIPSASKYYKRCLLKSDFNPNLNTNKSNLSSQGNQIYLKAITNYAVTLEKMGKRQESIRILEQIKSNAQGEVRILNNLGILEKRAGNSDKALKNFQNALDSCKKSKQDIGSPSQSDQQQQQFNSGETSEEFFPNYNMGVYKASLYDQPNQNNELNDNSALKFFQKALNFAKSSNEEVYQINVLINMSIIYERQKQIDKACDCLLQVLALNPQVKSAQIRLEQLKNQEKSPSKAIQNNNNNILNSNASASMSQGNKSDGPLSNPIPVILSSISQSNSQQQQQFLKKEENYSQIQSLQQTQKQLETLNSIEDTGLPQKLIEPSLNLTEKQITQTIQQQQPIPDPLTLSQTIVKNQPSVQSPLDQKEEPVLTNTLQEPLSNYNTEQAKIQKAIQEENKSNINPITINYNKNDSIQSQEKTQILPKNKIRNKEIQDIAANIQEEKLNASKKSEKSQESKINNPRSQNKIVREEVQVPSKESTAVIETNLIQQSQIQPTPSATLQGGMGIHQIADIVRTASRASVRSMTNKSNFDNQDQQKSNTEAINVSKSIDHVKLSQEMSQILGPDQMEEDGKDIDDEELLIPLDAGKAEQTLPAAIQTQLNDSNKTQPLNQTSTQSIVAAEDNNKDLQEELNQFQQQLEYEEIKEDQKIQEEDVNSVMYRTQGSVFKDTQTAASKQLLTHSLEGPLGDIEQEEEEDKELEEETKNNTQIAVGISQSQVKLQTQESKQKLDEDHQDISETPLEQTAQFDLSGQDAQNDDLNESIDHQSQSQHKTLDHDQNKDVILQKQEEEVLEEEKNDTIDKTQALLPIRDKQAKTSSQQSQSKYSTAYMEESFLSWTREQCLERLAINPLDLRCIFRLGILDLGEGKLQSSLQRFLEVVKMDDDYQNQKEDKQNGRLNNQDQGLNSSSGFMRVHVCMKLGETYYKMEKCSEALEWFVKAEEAIKPKEDYLIELFKAKSLDKAKKFEEAITSYKKSLELYQTEDDQESQLTGNILFRLGWAEIRTRTNVNEGIQNLILAQEHIPTNLEINIKLAGVLFREQNKFTESLQYINKALELQPEGHDTLLLKGKIFDKLEKYQEAAEIFTLVSELEQKQNERAQKQGDNSSQVQEEIVPPQVMANTLFYLGQTYEKMKDYKKCAALYKRSLTMDSKNLGACVHLANLLASIGEGERALKYFKHALKQDPDSISINYGIAKTIQQFQPQNKAQAITHYEFILSKDPKHFRSMTQLAIILIEQEEYEKAADLLKKSIALNKSYALSLQTMGNLLFETGNSQDSMKYYKHALSLNEKDVQALIGLGNASYDMKNLKRAISFYEKVMEIDPKQADACYNLGNALYLNGDVEKSIEYYKQSILLSPKKIEPYYNLGNALCAQKSYEEAIKAYLKTLELSPQNSQALNNLGYSYYMLGKYQEAIDAYSKTLQIDEKSAEAHFNIASAYNDIGDKQMAIKHYQRVGELDKQNVDAFLCLAQIYDQIYNKEMALRYYNQVLAIEPNNFKAQQAINSAANRLARKPSKK